MVITSTASKGYQGAIGKFYSFACLLTVTHVSRRGVVPPPIRQPVRPDNTPPEDYWSVYP